MKGEAYFFIDYWVKNNLNLPRFERTNDNKTVNNKHEILANHLSPIKWDYFVTISPKQNISTFSFDRLVHSFYEYLNSKYSHQEIGVMYGIEKYKVRNGNHFHGVIKLDISLETLKKETKAFFNVSNVKILRFDDQLQGDAYSMKQGLYDGNYDVLISSNLQDTIRTHLSLK